MNFKPFLGTLFVALLATSACKTFDAQTPPSFVELDDSGVYDYRATSADGLVLAARSLKNNPKGNLAFWSETVSRKLRDGEGYALVSEKTVTAKSGQTGTQFVFEREQEGAPHRYSLAVFVTDKRIFLVEAGGTKANMETYVATVDAAVSGFRIR